jgi:hypothetical protein
MYYSLDYKLDYDALGFQMVALGPTPAPEVAWTMGVRCPKPVPEPIECYLDPRSGPVMPDWIAGLTLFSQRFVDVLKSAGIRNMDIYDAVVIDRERDKRYTNYKAVNIIGRVSCADLEKSEYIPDYEPPLMEFEKLVIDESRTMGVPLFRLAESVGFILVSGRVKQAIEAAGLLGVRVVSLEDPSAY